MKDERREGFGECVFCKYVSYLKIPLTELFQTD